MVPRKVSGKRRRGRVAYETALVLTLFTSFVFGICEYGRLVMDWNVLNNAAREGCRYALANNTSGTVGSDVQAVVLSYMGSEAASFTNLTVNVTGTHQGASTSVTNLIPGDLITVSVSGKYVFMNIIPLIRMPATFTVTSSVTMVCEGGT